MSKHELQFENEHVCVWKTVISPNQPLERSEQSAGRVLIGLKGGTIQQKDPDGSLSTFNLETHKALWLKADAQHAPKEPMEIMVIEMKQPKDRPLPSIPID